MFSIEMATVGENQVAEYLEKGYELMGYEMLYKFGKAWKRVAILIRKHARAKKQDKEPHLISQEEMRDNPVTRRW